MTTSAPSPAAFEALVCKSNYRQRASICASHLRDLRISPPHRSDSMASRRKKLCSGVTAARQSLRSRSERTNIDPKLCENVVKQSNRAAKNISRTDDMISRLRTVRQSVRIALIPELVATQSRHLLRQRDAFQNRYCGIRKPRIGITVTLTRKVAAACQPTQKRS